MPSVSEGLDSGLRTTQKKVDATLGYMLPCVTSHSVQGTACCGNGDQSGPCVCVHFAVPLITCERD